MTCEFGAPVIIAKVTGTVSFASSLHVLWHLVIQGHVRRRQYYPYRPSAAAAAQQRRNSFSNSSRKSKRIATVNRIVCAVSIVDALSALSGHMLGTWLVPSSDSFSGSSGSTGCYTHGTVGSCRGQGAVFLTSVSLSVLWNASLVVTFVMLITWRHSEAQLARSEKWLLGVPIVIALLYGGLIPLLLDLYHPTSTRWYCFFMASLSSSSSSSQSTSTSTDSSTVTAGRAMASIGCLLHLLAITATLVGMATLYKSVREQEKKVEKFTMNSSERQQKFSSELSRRRSSLDEEALPSRNQSKLSPPALSLSISLSQQSQPFQQQQQQLSQQQPPPQHRPQQRRTSFVLEEPKRRASLQGAHLSKKVQQQALRYVVAYSLVWIWFYLDVLLESIGVPPTTMGRKVVRVANAVCWPLQGFVNALSFSNFKYFEKSSKLLIDGLSKGRNSFVELSGRIVNALKKEMEKECLEDDDYDSDDDDDEEDDHDDNDNSFTMTHDNHDQFNTSSLTNNGGTMTNNKIFYGDYTTNPQQPYLHSAPTDNDEEDEEDEENSPQPPPLPPPSNNNDTTHTTNNTYNINNNDNVNDIVTDMETTTTTLPMTPSEDSEAMLSLT